MDEIEQSRENDKKKLTEAQESYRQANERLEKVSRPKLFGGIDERRVREKEATVQVELESLDQAVSLYTKLVLVYANFSEQHSINKNKIVGT